MYGSSCKNDKDDPKVVFIVLYIKKNVLTSNVLRRQHIIGHITVGSHQRQRFRIVKYQKEFEV